MVNCINMPFVYVDSSQRLLPHSHPEWINQIIISIKPSWTVNRRAIGKSAICSTTQKLCREMKWKCRFCGKWGNRNWSHGDIRHNNWKWMANFTFITWNATEISNRLWWLVKFYVAHPFATDMTIRTRILDLDRDRHQMEEIRKTIPSPHIQ